MDERTNRAEPGSEPGAVAPQGTVVPMGDEWAAGVHPVAISAGSRRLRWGVAVATVLVVALATTAGAFVLSGAAGAKSLTAGMAPKNSIFFMEVRTDLPGDQRAKLADFLSHFPGFQDRAQFDSALDVLLNKLTSEVSPDLRYSSAFKPWIEGEVSIAVTSLGGYPATWAGATPIVAGMGPSSTPGYGGCLPACSPPSAVAIFALKDRSGAERWANDELSRLNVKTTPQDYAGTTLYSAGPDGTQGAYALTEHDLVLGTVTGVKAALDTRSDGSLAENPDYQAAMKSLSGDSLACFYVNLPTLVRQGIESYGSAMYGLLGATLPPALDTKAMPAWLAGAVRAESDRMVVEMTMPRTGTASLGNHVSRIASSLPGSTVGVLEMHSLGRFVGSGLAALESMPPLPGVDTSSIDLVKSALSLIGTDWLGDGTAVVTRDGSTFDGGVVVEASDAATAQSKVDLIANLVGLSSIATGFKSHGETYKGHKITVVTVPESAGYGRLQLAIGARDNLIVVGYTDAFVKAVLDTTPASSLASQADYSAAMGAAGTSNEGSLYINVPALEDQIGRAVLPSSPSRWTLDYMPYFGHVGGIACAVIDGNTVILRLVVPAR
ncbi:MAG: DUF3352 domain-containing protein [Candidatus Limnocylindrales bacterium]